MVTLVMDFRCYFHDVSENALNLNSFGTDWIDDYEADIEHHEKRSASDLAANMSSISAQQRKDTTG